MSASFLIRSAAEQIKRDGYIHPATHALMCAAMAAEAMRLAAGEA